jgi:hypothetical protein
MPLTFFVWDSFRKEYIYVEWEQLWKDLPLMPVKTFHDGPAYWEVDVDQYLWLEGSAA